MPAAKRDKLKNLSRFANVSRSNKGRSSCKNCGNLLDIVDSRQNLEEQPSVSRYVNHSSQGLERSRPRSPMSSRELEKERPFQGSWENFTAHAAQAMHTVRPHSESISDSMYQRAGQTRWQLTSQQNKS